MTFMLSKLKSYFKKSPFDELVSKDSESYFLHELKIAEMIPDSKYGLVLAHLNHEQKLSSEDIELKFNVSNSDALLIAKKIKDIYYKASCEKAWDDNFIKTYSSGVKAFILRSSGTNQHCDFCLSNFDKELEVSRKVFKGFHQKCKCVPYKKSFMEPVMKF